MNIQLSAMILTVAASSAMAQIVPADPPAAETQKLKKVDGSRRVLSSTLAGSGRTGKAGPAPSLVVDANGKTVGRYAIAAFVLVPYNNQMMALYLGGDFDAQYSKNSQDNFSWGNNSIFYYQTPDCTSTPYSGFGINTGTKYIGFTVKDDGQHYAYVGDPAKSVNNVLMQSMYDFDKETCFKLGSSITGVAGGAIYMPLSDVIPLAPVGTPPFILK